MTVSSGTPQGEPNVCPVCGLAVRLEPSRPVGDARCPACGALLWFAARDDDVRLFDPAAVDARERLVRGAQELGIASLDVVEWVMEHAG